MSEQEITQPPVSEEVVDTGAVVAQSEQPARQVPLEALEAERRKRQDLEAQNRVLSDYANRYQQLEAARQQSAPTEDETDLVNKRDLRNLREKISREDLAVLKREVSEETFKEVNPDAIKQINLHLEAILERKPWLAKSIEEASNRYSRAYEIVQDYAPAAAAKSQKASEAQRIVENSKKPGNPVAMAKSATLTGSDYLKSIAGTKEFREYRSKLMRG